MQMTNPGKVEVLLIQPLQGCMPLPITTPVCNRSYLN